MFVCFLFSNLVNTFKLGRPYAPELSMKCLSLQGILHCLYLSACYICCHVYNSIFKRETIALFLSLEVYVYTVCVLFSVKQILKKKTKKAFSTFYIFMCRKYLYMSAESKMFVQNKKSNLTDSSWPHGGAIRNNTSLRKFIG